MFEHLEADNQVVRVLESGLEVCFMSAVTLSS